MHENSEQYSDSNEVKESIFKLCHSTIVCVCTHSSNHVTTPGVGLSCTGKDGVHKNFTVQDLGQNVWATVFKAQIAKLNVNSIVKNVGISSYIWPIKSNTLASSLSPYFILAISGIVLHIR